MKLNVFVKQEQNKFICFAERRIENRGAQATQISLMKLNEYATATDNER